MTEKRLSMEKWWNNADGGKPKFSEKKPVAVPLCPPQIPYGFTENISGSLLKECTMKIGSGVSELIKIIMFVNSYVHFILMYSKYIKQTGSKALYIW